MQSKIVFYEKYPNKFLVYLSERTKSAAATYLVPLAHVKNKSIAVLRGLFGRHILGKAAPPLRLVSANPNWDAKLDAQILEIEYNICQESEINNANFDWRPIQNFFNDVKLQTIAP